MARAIWKGAISFGLVLIPVSLTTAVSSSGIDFDWLDKRTMDPVGYKQINKTTGREIDRKNIVKGIQYEKGRYVVLSEDEIKTAHPRATQTIDIFSFIDKNEVPITHIDTPYYLAPDKRGEKVYALLREALVATNKVALANVVVRVRQHLAVLMPVSSALVLILLRWPEEVRDLSVLELNESVTEPTLAKSEKEMAKRLIEDMTASWDPEEYHDDFQEKIMALVDKKVREGKVEAVESIDEEDGRKTADIIDLTELLKRSLNGKAKDASRTKPEKSTPAKSRSVPKDATEEKLKATSKTTPKTTSTGKNAVGSSGKEVVASTSAKTTTKGNSDSKSREENRSGGRARGTKKAAH